MKVYNNIFPYLPFDDIVRFGKVCREAKLLADDYLLGEGAAIAGCVVDTAEVEIDDVNFKMSDFLARGIPASHIYINNKKHGKVFFENDDVVEFASNYGKKVSKLRIGKFSTVLLGNERIFYAKLVNLKSLVIESIASDGDNELILCREICDNEDIENEDENVKTPYPDTVLNVMSVRFNYDAANFCAFSYAFSNVVFVSYLKKIESLGQTFWPKLCSSKNVGFGSFLDSVMQSLYSFEMKEYDMSYFFDLDRNIISTNCAKILEFLLTCFTLKVNLTGVDAYLLEVVMPIEVNRFETNILSMRNICGTAQHMNLESLEEIDIQTSRSSISKECEVNAFVKLKSLKIVIDSNFVQKICFFGNGVVLTNSGNATTKDLLNYFFVKFKRPTLKEVFLSFDDEFVRKNGNCREGLPFVKIVQLSNCCPNLTRLTLCRYPGTNKSITTLFTSLNCLQDICFDSCTSLGNVAFIGLDVKNPCCLQLRESLKKLSLKGLDKMPKITNTLFSLAIKHLGLTHFCITSSKPLDTEQVIDIYIYVYIYYV